jgi:hypothetical protein
MHSVFFAGAAVPRDEANGEAAPVYDVVTYAGQTFGSAGPLRYFEMSENGGRIGFDLTTLATPGYSPRPEIGTGGLPASGNRWEIVEFIGRSHETISGTCAAESFATTEGDASVQHIYLNCVDLDI